MNASCMMSFPELKTLNFWRAVVAEFLVTIIYIIIVCGAGLFEPNSTNIPSHLHISLTVGITVAVLASGFWDISGGHFNPAVTLAMLLSKKLSVLRFLFYVIAQSAGSIVGAALLYTYTPKVMRGNIGVLSLHKDLDPGVGFVIELTLTFQYIWTIVASTDPKRQYQGFQAPLAIGLSAAIGLLMGIPYTGAAMNPIRAFGPAIVMNLRENQWVYWAGPVTGSIFATLCYQYIFKLTQVSKSTVTETELNDVICNNNIKRTVTNEKENDPKR